MGDEIIFFLKGKLILFFIPSKVLESNLGKSKIKKHLQIKKQKHINANV